MTPVLYDYFRSSAAYRVRIALNLKGVAFDRIPVPLLEDAQCAPDYIARNPQGLVPALDIGTATLTQSYAIIDWLDRAHPEPRLIPEEPLARARAIALAMAIGCDIHPINNLRVLRRLKEMGHDQPARDAWSRDWIARGFAALEAMAGDGPYLGGAAPGLADIFLVPQMANARRVALDFAPYPRLVAIDAAASALPAFAAAHPDRFAPAP